MSLVGGDIGDIHEVCFRGLLTQEVKPRLRDHFIELLGQVGNATCGTTHFVGIYRKEWRHN